MRIPQPNDLAVPAPDVSEPEIAGPDNRRQWPRYVLPARNTFTVTADGRSGACAIVDISLGGARLRIAGEVPHNLEIRIEHPDMGHAYARRCWSASGRLGVIFDHSEISLAFIAQCLAASVGSGRAEPAV